jgi:hypothetical protein
LNFSKEEEKSQLLDYIKIKAAEAEEAEAAKAESSRKEAKKESAEISDSRIEKALRDFESKIRFRPQWQDRRRRKVLLNILEELPKATLGALKETYTTLECSDGYCSVSDYSLGEDDDEDDDETQDENYDPRRPEEETRPVGLRHGLGQEMLRFSPLRRSAYVDFADTGVDINAAAADVDVGVDESVPLLSRQLSSSGPAAAADYVGLGTIYDDDEFRDPPELGLAVDLDYGQLGELEEI